MASRGWGGSRVATSSPRYVKVTFLNGAALRPVPPGSGKDEDSRWVGVYEGELRRGQMSEWVWKAAAIPGWDGF